MKKTISFSLAVVLVALPALLGEAQPQKKKKPCAKSMAVCADTGCGLQFDANLNKLKNLTSDDQGPEPQTLDSIKKIKNPKHFTMGGEREELRDLGEGQKITVVGYLIAAKPEGGESCNCGLSGLKNTDNHLVLVTKRTLTKPDFKEREPDSITAEITPRVRTNHSKWTKSNLDPMIASSPKKALLVRLTGLLMFDSEHFLRNALVRKNNWEIHPILEFQYCTKLHTCKADSDAGWRRLDSL